MSVKRKLARPGAAAVTGRAGDILNGMLGIDCKVPQTDIVAVGRERFPQNSLTDSVAAQTLPGAFDP
jgi:hypothetical protein